MNIAEVVSTIQSLAAHFPEMQVVGYSLSLGSGDKQVTVGYWPGANRAPALPVALAPARAEEPVEEKPKPRKRAIAVASVAEPAPPPKETVAVVRSVVEDAAPVVNPPAATNAIVERAVPEVQQDLFGETVEPAPKPEKPKPISIEDMRVALVRVQSKLGKDRAVELLRSLTPPNQIVLGKVKEEDRQRFLDECVALAGA